MGKDKHKDGETATSSETNRDQSQDQEARDAALAKTITEAVARETQTVAEVVAREMAKAHAQSMRIAHQPCQQPLKLLLDQMVLESWTPLTGQGTRLSTRDGNYGHIRLDSPLIPWEGDSEKTKISYFHHWVNGEGISQIEGWKNNKTLISQSEHDALPNKEGKYSSEKNRELLYTV